MTLGCETIPAIHNHSLAGNTKQESINVVRIEPGQLPLKVLHILDHSLPLHSGYAFRSQSILSAQRDRGWRPVALTSPKHERSWKSLPSDKDKIDNFLYYRTSATNNSIPVAGEVQLIRALARRIEAVAKIERPDLLHAHSPVLNAIAALSAGRNLGLPVVYEIRAFWEDAMVDHRTTAEGSLKYRTTRTLETWACRFVAQTAVICEGLRTDLMSRGIPGEKISIVANGVNPDNFGARKPDLQTARRFHVEGKQVLGFIGSFNRYEGLDLLVKAMVQLASIRPDVVLLLVGGGEMEEELRAQIANAGMQERVILTGRIPQENIPAIYSLMDAVVYPRYSIRLTELVTPLKPLESMAMGKTVVASDIGGHREMIRDGHTGILFKSGDVSDLTKTLNRILDDASLRERLGAQGLEWVHGNRTWKTTTSVYSEIYSRALGTSLPDC
jgi:PEP-CTERM/exosortase A-associated glycosyltransferase